MSYIKVYKDVYEEDVLDMLYEAYNNNHLMYKPSYELAQALCEMFFEATEGGSQYTKTDIYDYIRFELDVSTIDDVRSHTNGLESASHDEIESFLLDHTYYIGSFDIDNTIYYAYTAF